MRGQRAIMTPHLPQPPVEQGEMHRLIRPHPHPFVGEGCGKFPAKAADQIERQVDRHKFDMRQCMDHRDPRPLGADPAAPWHLVGRQQRRRSRSRRHVGHGGIEPMRQPPQPPRARHRPRRHQLGGWLGRHQHMGTSRAHRVDMCWQGQSARAASSTSAAWPFTFTLGQTRCTVPSAPNRKVARSMPI